MKHTLLLVVFLFLSVGLSAQSKTFAGQAEDLRVFPNPVAEYFKVGYSERVSSIQVMNAIGRRVKNFKYQTNQRYDVGDLPRGYYLVQFRDSDNRVLHTQRVSKR